MRSVDVLIAGAGPAGCATALALAGSGAEVELVDPVAEPGHALSGEWLHPAGVLALGRLGIPLRGAEFTRNHGFVLHPDDEGPPIPCPYPEGTAVSMHHHTLVGRLRQAVRETPGMTLRQGDRVVATSPEGRVRTGCGEFRARYVIGADGRASAVRRSLLPGEPSPRLLSRTAGLLLPDASLPREGYGHVFLGGPGPVLAYRLSPALIRLCADVPLSAPGATGIRGYLHQGYAHVLPAGLRGPFLGALADGRIQWAGAKFRRRVFYGRHRCALVGDAVGHGHPLAALGMALGILDAECLARCLTDDRTLASYTGERSRRSWAGERLAAAMHRTLTGQDDPSVLLRRAAFDLWRRDIRERHRVLGLLGIQDTRRDTFALLVARLVVNALDHVTREAVVSHDIADTTRRLAGLADWLLWLGGPSVGLPPRSAG
ncbi:FAD-dependent oxidoreductase [Streptomyces sp. NPDC002643]